MSTEYVRAVDVLRVARAATPQAVPLWWASDLRFAHAILAATDAGYSLGQQALSDEQRATAPAPATADARDTEQIEPKLSDELHPDTAKLVRRFAQALGNKLLAAQRKYGYSNNWQREDWADECRAELMRHIEKGDPRDVAAYCAFLWHHDWPTALLAATPAQAQKEPDCWAILTPNGSRQELKDVRAELCALLDAKKS